MMGAFGGAVQLTGRSGILESGVWTESRSTFEETMAIYIHDAPFSLPPFPSDKCDRCIINGPIKVAQRQAGSRRWWREELGRSKSGTLDATRN